MLGLTLVGTPRPIEALVLEKLGKLPADYLKLMATWGPGRALGRIDLPDPTVPDGSFALLQERFHLHAPHLRAQGRWGYVTSAALAEGVVLGVRHDGAAILAHAGHPMILAPDGTCEPAYSLEDLFRRARSGDLLGKVPTTYATESGARAALYAALAAGDEAAADGLLAELYEREAAWTVLEIAHDLALPTQDTAAIPGAVRAAYFAHCVRLAKRSDTERLKDLPVRAIGAALANGELSAEHGALVRALAYPASPFTGPADATERALLAQLRPSYQDRAILAVLADHLETRGRTLRAQLLREQAEGLSFAEVEARGLIILGSQVDSAQLLEAWTAAWAADDPATEISALTEAAAALPREQRHAIIAWMAHGDADRLATEPAAFPLLVLALRSELAGTACTALVAQKATAAAPWLLAALRQRPALALAEAHHELGKLTAAELTEVLGWLAANEVERRAAALALLQRHAKDDRVLEAALAHFVDGHPASERIVTRRKADPRVLPALHAAFERAEQRSIADGRNVRYTEDYRILARYLAKLGDPRGKAAWERAKTMARIDRAAADRAIRREGM